MFSIQQMLESVHRDAQWQAKLDEQEKLQILASFTCADALFVGSEIARLAKAGGRALAVQIELGGAVVFQHHMDGTSRFHDWFIEQKANVVRETGVSSMRAFLNCVYRGMYRDEPWFKRDGNYVLCGGSVPLMLEGGERIGILTVSGGTHEEDHQFAIEGLARFHGSAAPSILN